jgi:hypothetical protein
MKTALPLALTIGSVTGIGNLRSTPESHVLDVKDTFFIEGLAQKYNCRAAGATLEETITKIKTKNAAEQVTLGKECTTRRAGYNNAWATAQSQFNTNFAKIDPEEMTTYNRKILKAQRSFEKIKATLAKAVSESSRKVRLAQDSFKTINNQFLVAKGVLEGAERTFTSDKNNFLTVIKPTRLKNINDSFDAAKVLADNIFANTIKNAKIKRMSAIKTCESITAARKKHIDADEKLLNEEVGPLIKQLSALKCVDSFDSQRKATRQFSMLEVDNEADRSAECSMTKKRIDALIETKMRTRSVPIMNRFSSFSDRVAQERAHMNSVHTKCMANLSSIFMKEEHTASALLSKTLTKITNIKTKSNLDLEKELENIIQTNQKIIAEKKKKLIAPTVAKDKANRELVSAKSELESSQNSQRAMEAIAITQHNQAIEEATNTKSSNILSRRAGLQTLKITAESKFKENKKFVEEYCGSAEKDLKKEQDILKKIEAKLMSLTVSRAAVRSDTEIMTFEKKGSFKANKYHGEGTITTGKDKYVGTFKDDEKHGKGTMVYADGSKYVGSWQNDEKNGHGTHTLSDGEKYTGNFKDGEYHGKGHHILANGDKYVGTFQSNMYHGEGTQTHADGDKYIGGFLNDMKHGRGTMIYADGSKYVGNFQNDKYHGHGTHRSKDGKIYTGMFENDKRHGKGTLIHADGKKHVGEWVDGQIKTLSLV